MTKVNKYATRDLRTQGPKQKGNEEDTLARRALVRPR
jgi:hypothetical protein